MGHYIPVDGISGLGRCPQSGAIININKDEIQKARDLKERRKQKEAEFWN